MAARSITSTEIQSHCTIVLVAPPNKYLQRRNHRFSAGVLTRRAETRSPEGQSRRRRRSVGYHPVSLESNQEIPAGQQQNEIEIQSGCVPRRRWFLYHVHPRE